MGKDQFSLLQLLLYNREGGKKYSRKCLRFVQLLSLLVWPSVPPHLIQRLLQKQRLIQDMRVTMVDMPIPQDQSAITM